MPRIAFVINTLTGGGAERTISNISLNLPESYEIDVIVNDDAKVDYPFRGHLVSLGMAPRKNKLSFWYQIVVFTKRIRSLKRLKNSKRYKAVISFSESASIANILSGKNHGKVIISVRVHLSSVSDERLYRWFGFPVIKKIYNRADRIVAVSKGVENDLIKHFGIKKSLIRTIPNGCDLNRIHALMDEPLTHEEELWFQNGDVIVTMGRMEYQKGQWHLIRAISKLRKETDIHCTLLIMGEGSQREYLQRLIGEYHLDDCIKMVGFCENPFRIMLRATLYVLPSLFEGMGNSLIEAMACGLPCISTDHPSGAREILAPDSNVEEFVTDKKEYADYGILIPPLDGKRYSSQEPFTREETLMEEAIKEMLTNNELQKQYRNASKRRAAEMKLDAVIGAWVDEIEH